MKTSWKLLPCLYWWLRCPFALFVRMLVMLNDFKYCKKFYDFAPNKYVCIVLIWLIYDFDLWCFNATFSNISAISYGDQFSNVITPCNLVLICKLMSYTCKEHWIVSTRCSHVSRVLNMDSTKTTKEKNM